MDIRGGRGATFPAPRSLGICAGLSPRDALSPFPGFTAEKVYDSPLGFARFVDQAAAGIMEFTPSDFPTVQQQLENLGIARLRTRFRIEGGEAVRERLHALPSALIRSILHIEK